MNSEIQPKSNPLIDAIATIANTWFEINGKNTKKCNNPGCRKELNVLNFIRVNKTTNKLSNNAVCHPCAKSGQKRALNRKKKVNEGRKVINALKDSGASHEEVEKAKTTSAAASDYSYDKKVNFNVNFKICLNYLCLRVANLHSLSPSLSHHYPHILPLSLSLSLSLDLSISSLSIATFYFLYRDN